MRGVQKMGKNGQKNTEHMVQNRDATQKLKKKVEVRGVFLGVNIKSPERALFSSFEIHA